MYAVDPDPKPVDIWHALADPTRRELIDRLAGGARTTSQLCDGMPMSRFGVMKHLGILERAGLVIARRHGRLRLNHLNAAPLRALQNRWLSAHAGRVADAALSLSDTAEETPMPTDPQSNQTAVVDVALEWAVAASVQRVWNAIVEQPERWWPAAHRAGSAGSRMSFDARIGGQLREEGADGSGLVWYNVIAIEPMRSIDLSGQLATRYGGPATSLLHLELLPGSAEGTSILKLTDSVFGRIGANMRASLISGWEEIVGQGLVGHVMGESK